MHRSPLSLIAENWHEMDLPVRVSVSLGLVSGAGFSIVYGDILAPYGAVTALSGLVISLFYFPFALFGVTAIVSLAGSVTLLLHRMSLEQRGIAGFIVFVASVPTVVAMLLLVAAQAKGS